VSRVLRRRSALNDTLVDAGGLRIRLKRREDALDDFRWRRDPEIARFDGSEPLKSTFTDYLRQVEYDLSFVDPRRQVFALDSPEGVHFGNIMYYNADGDSAEIGICVAQGDYRDRGIGTAAMVAFVRYLWNTLAVRELYLHTLDWNVRARASFARAGFEETARVVRGPHVFIRMEARREWWLLHDMEGRFDATSQGRRISNE
jgi:RimJ/RimL family protein N-acetyltransferase